MRVKSLLLGSFIIILFSACSSNRFTIDGAPDDVFWSKNNSENTIQQIEPSTSTNSQYNGNNGVTNNYVAPSAPSQQYSYSEEERARNAQNEWDNRRNLESQQQNQQYNNNQTQSQNYNEDDYQGNSRRLGSSRNYYYEDPYFNSLSNNWGWTSFYNPMFRPGFYNFAPGFNIGLGWSNFGGFGMGMGYNTGWGMGMGMGWNNWGYSPWGFNGFYDPWFNPLWGPQWGWNRWGYGGFYSPWYRNGWRNNRNCCFNYNGNNDIVTNRPLLRPRSQVGGGNGLPPGGKVQQGTRPGDPQRSVQNPDQMRTARPGTQQEFNTTRPGGDLVNDKNGNPVYVSPRSRPTNEERVNGTMDEGSRPMRNSGGSEQQNINRENRSNDNQPNYQQRQDPQQRHQQQQRQEPQQRQQPQQRAEPQYQAPPSYQAPEPRSRDRGSYSPSGGSSGGGSRGSSGSGTRGGGGSSGGGGSRSRPR